MLAQPSTSSRLPASRQYSLTDAVNIILNDSSPENRLAADSDFGEEFDARVETSFNPSDATDSDEQQSPDQKGGVSTQGRNVLELCFIVYFCFSGPCTIAWLIQ